MIDATFSLGKSEAPSVAVGRDKSGASPAAGASSFSVTLAAQETREPKPEQTAEQAVTAPAEQPAAHDDKSKQAKASDADSADDGSDSDKAAAAAATLAQMLAGAAPAPAPLAQSLPGESPESLPDEAVAADNTQQVITSASVAQTEVAADATQAGGAGLAGKGAFAAFASLIEASGTSESDINAAATESDSARPATEAKPPAPTPPGLTGLSLSTNPLRAAALATALNPGLPAGLQSEVGTHEWAEELGTRLAVMTAQGDQSGSLRLSPEHLGPLEVQIRMQDDKANVVFGAQHADTRRALEEALPRLREMFAASGLQLGDAGVSREAPRQAQAAWTPRAAGGLAGLESDMSGPVADAQRRYHLGLLDTVA